VSVVAKKMKLGEFSWLLVAGVFCVKDEIEELFVVIVSVRVL